MIFKNKLVNNNATGPQAEIVQSLSSRMRDLQAGPLTAQVAAAAWSMESLSSADSMVFNDAASSIQASLEGLISSLNMSNSVTQAQRDAANVATMLTGDIRGYLRQPVAHSLKNYATESIVPVNLNFSDAITTRPKYGDSYAAEAYDERDNRNAAVYSVTYNLMAARQNEFGETWYPTVTISPDNVGFMVSVRLLQVYNEFKRDISGAPTDYKKQNLLRAIIDHTILKNDQTKIVPIVRPASLDKFVSPADVAPYTKMLEGEALLTAPLKTGVKFDLMGISQTDAMLASSAIGVDESIDPTVQLEAIYVKFGNDVVKFNTLNLPVTMFAPAPQDLARRMNLAFTTTSLVLTKDTKLVTGAALTDLADIVNNDLTIRLNADVSGYVNLETGEGSVFGLQVSLHAAYNNQAEQLDPTVAPVAPVATILNTGTIIGCDLKAYRANLSRRQRGQLIDTTFYNQLYGVNLRSPITAIRPVTSDGSTDTSDLAALINATQIRTSVEAVTTLIEAEATLASYVKAADSSGNGPEVLGVARWLVRPTHFYATLDCATELDSLKASDRIEDLHALIVNKIRDITYRLLRDSNYLTANEAYYGSNAKLPTVIIGTDPVIARYLMVTGDLRTLGPNLSVKIVDTMDDRMKNEIFIGLGHFDGETNSRPNPLHNGCMAWKPEMTLVLPISRDNTINKELTVTPAFGHIQNLPILGRLSVTNIETVIAAKMAVWTKAVP